MDIKWIVFDIDGVLTDGNVYIDYNGNEMKAYRLTEIDTLNDLIAAGYRVAAITGEDTPIVSAFKRLIQWDRFYAGCKDKMKALRDLEEKEGVEDKNICYIGDGKYDLAPIQHAGLGVCPSNAIPEVKAVADVVLEKNGANGCIYELFEYLKSV